MKPFAGSWLRAASLAMAVGLSAGSAAGADGISRDADEVLRAMSKFLGGLKSFSVSTDIRQRNHHQQRREAPAEQPFDPVD